MQDELAIAVHRERGCVVAAVTGEIDISTVGGLRIAYSSWPRANRR